MTVPSTTSATSYAGTGTTPTYAFTWEIAQPSDLVLIQLVVATGVITPLVLNTDYTISGVSIQTGGTVTLTAGNLPTGTTLFIGSDPVEIQALLLQQGANYNPADVMNALDLLTRMMQATRRVAGNAIQIPLVESLAGFTTTLPAAAVRANAPSIGFDGAGRMILNGGTTSLPAGSVVQQIANVAALRLFANPISGYVVQTQGYYASADGGGGEYVWNASDARTDNGGTIIAVTGITTGRWNLLELPYQLNVRQFGAKGDGSTDDTAAIQACISAVPTSAGGGTPTYLPATSQQGGWVVYFSGGVYKITATLVIGARRVSLVGNNGGMIGSNGTIIYMTNSNLHIVDYTTGSLDTISVYGIVFQGNGKGTGTGNGLVLGTGSGQTCFDSQIRSCWFTAMPNACIYLTNAADMKITQCGIENAVYGIYHNVSTDGPGDINTIQDNTFYGLTYGVYVPTANNLVIANNVFWLCGTNPGGAGDDVSGGIVIAGNGAANVRGVHVSGNFFRACVNDMIVNGNNGSNSGNTGTNDVSLIGNTSELPYRRHIYVEGANVVRIIGNSVNGASQEANNTYDAIFITGTSDRVVIDGNTATANNSGTRQRYGLNVGASVTNLTVGINKVEGSTANSNVTAGATFDQNSNLQGTWTPTILGSSTPGTQTYSGPNTVGNWTRIGNLVIAQCTILMTAKDGTTAGNLQIGGLPFPTAQVVSVAIGAYGNLTLNAGAQLGGRGGIATSVINLIQSVSGTGSAAVPASGLSNTTEIDMTVVYVASA